MRLVSGVASRPAIKQEAIHQLERQITYRIIHEPAANRSDQQTVFLSDNGTWFESLLKQLNCKILQKSIAGAYNLGFDGFDRHENSLK
jgi:hypothetical protein